jgi:hypothetical protein
VGLYWVPGHAGLRGNEIIDELARDGSAPKFVEPSRPWESLGRIYEEGLDVGLLTSTGYGGEVLVTPKERFESYFRDPVWVPRLGFCLLTGQNPGLLLAFSLDIIS